MARVAEELDRRFKKGLNGSQILLIGLAYKKNVEDVRESPSIRLMELLENRGAIVEYYDPFVPEISKMRAHGELALRRAIEFEPRSIAEFDAALIATDHDGVDYQTLVDNSKLVVDTRNVCQRLGIVTDKIAKA